MANLGNSLPSFSPPLSRPPSLSLSPSVPPSLSLSLRSSLSLSLRVEFFDEQCQRESSVDSDEGEEPPKPVAVAVKVLQLSRLSVELGSNDLTSAGPGREEVDGE